LDRGTFCMVLFYNFLVFKVRFGAGMWIGVVSRMDLTLLAQHEVEVRKLEYMARDEKFAS